MAGGSAPAPFRRQESTLSTLSKVSMALSMTAPKDPRRRVFGLGVTCMVLALAETSFFMWTLSVSIQFDFLQEACASSTMAVISGLYLAFTCRTLYLMAVRRYCEAKSTQWMWWYATFATWIFNVLLIIWFFSLQDYLPIALAALALIFYSIFFKYAREDINKLCADCMCEKNKWCKGYEKGLIHHKIDAKKAMDDPEFKNLLKSIESQSIIFESESTNLSRNPSFKSIDSRNMSRNPSFKITDSTNLSRTASLTSADRSRRVSLKSKDISRSSSFNSRGVSRSSSFKNTSENKNRMTTIRQESVTDTLYGEEDRVDNKLQADTADVTEPQLRSHNKDGQNDSESFFGEVMKSLRKSGMVPKESEEHIPFVYTEHKDIPYILEQGISENSKIDLILNEKFQEFKKAGLETEAISNVTQEQFDNDIAVLCVNNDKLFMKYEDNNLEYTDNGLMEVLCDSDINKENNSDKKITNGMVISDALKSIEKESQADSYSLETASEEINKDIFLNKGSKEDLVVDKVPYYHKFANEQSEQIIDASMEQIKRGETIIIDTQPRILPKEFQDNIPCIDFMNKNAYHTTEQETTENSTIYINLLGNIQEFKNVTTEAEVTSNDIYEQEDKNITMQYVNNDNLSLKSEDCSINYQEYVKSITTDIHCDPDFSEQNSNDEKETNDLVILDSIKSIKKESLTDSYLLETNSEDIKIDINLNKGSNEELDALKTPDYHEQSEQSISIGTHSEILSKEFQEHIPFIDSDDENFPYTVEHVTTISSTRNIKHNGAIQEYKKLTTEVEVASINTHEHQDKDFAMQCVNDNRLFIKSEDNIINSQENTKNYISDVHSNFNFTEQKNRDKKEVSDMVVMETNKLIKEDSLIDCYSLGTGSEDENKDAHFNKGSKEKLKVLKDPNNHKFAYEESEQSQRDEIVSAETQFGILQSIRDEENMDTDSIEI